MELMGDVSCGEASWLPTALADALCSFGSSASPHARRALLTWLSAVRATTEEYELTSTPITLPPTPSPSPPPDDPFDDILGRIGREIFQLDEYQRRLASPSEGELAGSILDMFDSCLDEMTRADLAPDRSTSSTTFETAAGSPTEDASDGGSILSEDAPRQTSEPDTAHCSESDVNRIFDDGSRAPVVPPRRRRRRRCDSHSSESLYDNMDRPSEKPRPASKVESLKSQLDPDSEACTTSWSYRPCNTEAVASQDAADLYDAPVWSCRSGFHNSDEILLRVISQNRSQESIPDAVSELTGERCSVCTLPDTDDEVGCDSDSTVSLDDAACARADRPGAPPTPEYGDVCDARDDTKYASVMCDENIYEEIAEVNFEYATQISSERYSCKSVELLSCDESFVSEDDGSGSVSLKEEPMYMNLQDFGAYTISADVIYWKNLLLLPDYNEDEEDEWITPEESLMYGQERRPPYIIPRITSYRCPPPRLAAPPAHPDHHYSEDSLPGSPPQLNVKEVRGRHMFDLGPSQPGDWSPLSERGRLDIDRDFSSAAGESPPIARINKRFGSNDNLLNAFPRRPYNLAVPADGSEPELRDPYGVQQDRRRKSKSLVPGGRHGKSPVPAPRLLPSQDIGHGRDYRTQGTIFEAKVKRTKVSENGKKLRKNWTENHLVLTNTHLMFFKDEKAYQAAMSRGGASPPSPTSGAPRAAELILPLQGASVSKCTQQHTSRYTKSVAVTVGADQILIQDDSPAGAAFWYENIYKAISNTPPETQLELLGTPTSVRKNSKKVGESSNEDLTEAVDRTKTKKKLKKFLLRRPTREQLIKKGFYKDEPVFGRSLEEVCPPPESCGPRVPEFVQRCVQEIESSENMITDGLYRASGNLSQVQKIRLQIDQNNLGIVEQNSDVHVLTGSLKLFFRELKEPLIPTRLFNQTLAATGIKNRDARNKEFRDIVNSLPQCNYDTLKFLLQHLLRVTEHSAQNRMHIANLAIVFGPTLLWAPAELAHNIATDCIQQNHAIEILLTDFDEIFVKDRNKKS